MIEARLAIDGEGCIRSFDGRGHAGLSAPGSDPACAAFSVLARTAWEALDGLEGVGVEGTAENPGEIRFSLLRLPPESRGRVAGITDFLRVGLAGLERDYPGSFRILVR